MRDIWIHTHSSGNRHAVRYGKYTLAQFVRKELAVAYRDWFWQRRGILGRYTLEDLLDARLNKGAKHGKSKA